MGIDPVAFAGVQHSGQTPERAAELPFPSFLLHGYNCSEADLWHFPGFGTYPGMNLFLTLSVSEEQISR